MGYKTRKDRRKEYTGSKLFDTSCRCHGGCPWCESNRTFADRKRRTAADMELKEWRVWRDNDGMKKWKHSEKSNQDLR